MVDIESDHSLVNIFHVLSTPKTRGMATSDVLIPDTVSYQHGSLKWWYYYDPPKMEKVDGKIQERPGQVMRRDKRDCKPSKIFEAFTRGVKGNVPVATFLYKPGGYLEDVGEDCPTVVEFLDVEGLRDFLHVRDTKPDGILQRFMCKGSSNSVTQVIWTPYFTRAVRCQNIHKIVNHRLALWDRCVTHEGKSHLFRELICSKQAVDAFSKVCQNIVAHYLHAGHRAVTRLVLFFKFDEIKRILFLYPSVIITEKIRSVVHRAPSGKRRSVGRDPAGDPDVNKRMLMNLNPTYENARSQTLGPRCEEQMFMTPQGEYITARDFLDAQNAYSKDPFCPASTKMKKPELLMPADGADRLPVKLAAPYPCVVSSKSMLLDMAASGKPDSRTPLLDRLKERARSPPSLPPAHSPSHSPSASPRAGKVLPQQWPSPALSPAPGPPVLEASGGRPREIVLKASTSPARKLRGEAAAAAATKCSVLKFTRGGGGGCYVLQRTVKAVPAAAAADAAEKNVVAVQSDAARGAALPDRSMEVVYRETGRLQLAAPPPPPRHYLEDSKRVSLGGLADPPEDAAGLSTAAQQDKYPPDRTFYEALRELLDGVPLEPSDLLPTPTVASQTDWMAFTAALLAEELEAFKHRAKAAKEEGSSNAPAPASSPPQTAPSPPLRAASSKLAKLLRISGGSPEASPPASPRRVATGLVGRAPSSATAVTSPESDAALASPRTHSVTAKAKSPPGGFGSPGEEAFTLNITEDEGARPPTAETVIQRGVWGWCSAAVRERARAIAALHRYILSALDEVLYRCYSKSRAVAGGHGGRSPPPQVMVFPETVVDLLPGRLDALMAELDFERVPRDETGAMMQHVNAREWQAEDFVVYRRPHGDLTQETTSFSTHKVRQALVALQEEVVASRDYHFLHLHLFVRNAVQDAVTDFLGRRAALPSGVAYRAADAASDVLVGTVNGEVLRILLTFLSTRIAAYSAALRAQPLPPDAPTFTDLMAAPSPGSPTASSRTAVLPDDGEVPPPELMIAMPPFPYYVPTSGGPLADRLAL
eukprot:TRINITY_DN16158_c0_g1_i1.p1 TRINITY_DN16158_c0_g1~~TRINITY_DN16158_c0_g1_i1.p1  ORF type:complete len:1046 (+),score=389.21 TRINITY_DN16158_c0_g1_i1:169-3306(+)